MTEAIYPIEEVLPHRPPMILLDRMVARLPDGITVSTVVRSSDLFFRSDKGLPSYVSLEWMAQACAAFAGAEARDKGESVRIGFLLGTRDYRATRTWLAVDTSYLVRVRVEYRDDEMANFACEVVEGENEPALVTASVSVFHPPDARSIVEKQSTPDP